MLGTLIWRIRKDYVFLRKLSPKHELLKYFSVNEQGFNINPKDEIIDEFVQKFRGDVPPSEVARIRKIPFAVYKDMLTSSVFKNYISALESSINFAEMMN